MSRSEIKDADVTAEIKRILEEPGRLDEDLALAKDLVKDIETLVENMDTLYVEHAAQFIAVGVTIKVNVNVMHKPTLQMRIGLTPSPEGKLVDANGEDAEEVEG